MPPCIARFVSCGSMIPHFGVLRGGRRAGRAGARLRGERPVCGAGFAGRRGCRRQRPSKTTAASPAVYPRCIPYSANHISLCFLGVHLAAGSTARSGAAIVVRGRRTAMSRPLPASMGSLMGGPQPAGAGQRKLRAASLAARAGKRHGRRETSWKRKRVRRESG